MKRLPMKDQLKSKATQGGAILVFFAMVMIVLLGFVALVIDTGIGESGRGEEQTAVQNAALAGMSSYLEALKATPTPGGGGSPDDSFVRAKSAARKTAESILAASNRISKGYRLDPNSQTSLGTGGDGEITFGKMVWAMATPDGTPSAEEQQIATSCSSGGQLKLPCFIPQTDSDPPAGATAIEVRTTSRSNPIKTIFARVFGADRYEVGGAAIATLIPQNYLFLLDLSSSMVDQSYRRFGTRDPTCNPNDDPNFYCSSRDWFLDPACYTPASASYFAYDIDADVASAPPGCNSAVADGNCSCFSSATNSTNCFRIPRIDADKDDSIETEQDEELAFSGDPRDNERRRSRIVFGGYSSWWADTQGQNFAALVFPQPPKCLPNNDIKSQCPNAGSSADQCNPPWNPNQSPPREHYRLVTPKFGNDLIQDVETAPNPSAALVDFGPGGTATSFNASPEPLRSVLDATNDAMDFIKQRAVSADRFFLTGFDEDVLAARTTCRTESEQTCSLGETLVPPGSPAFAGFLNLTNVKPNNPNSWNSYAPTNRYHFLNRGFFPRVGYNTDIILALWKAYEELVANPSGSAAKNLVFLVTDGIANCRFIGSGAGPEYRFDSLPAYVNRRECDGNPDTIGVSVIEAIRQINRNLVHNGYNKSLVQLFQERGIAVSVILIGRNVQPHYLVRTSTAPGGQGGCLTSSEAIYGGINFVDWESSPNGGSYTCDPDADKSCIGGVNASLLARDALAALIDPNGATTLPISNLLYSELVAPTKGAWIPILPQRFPGNTNGSNFSAALRAKCNSTPRQPRESKIIDNVTLTDYGQVVDRRGRLLYDPEGRSQKDQIIDQVRQVLGGGYVLVAPAKRAD